MPVLVASLLERMLLILSVSTTTTTTTVNTEINLDGRSSSWEKEAEVGMDESLRER